VLNEIARRGGTAREVRVGLRTEVHMTGPDGLRRLRVVSRRRGDWQSSIREGDGKPEADRFWVFVDFTTIPTGFHIGSEDEVVHGIRTRHEEYLRRNGGRRVQNDASLHCAIRLRDLDGFARRWDLLGLDSGF
jgi:hypothetical protein